jgi:hypothetical protein
VTATTRPERVYPLKSRDVRPRADVVTAAFRVHYRLPGDEDHTHHVTPILWEYEARAFADACRTGDIELVDSPARPGGYERVIGSNAKPVVEQDRWWWWRKAARELGISLLTADLCDSKTLMDLALFVGRIPDAVKQECYNFIREAMQARVAAMQHTEHQENER